MVEPGKPGGPTVSQDLIARIAGVSQKTVSRVVNGSPRVSQSTRDAVMAAISDLGYRPNAAARTLATRKTSMIGIATFGEATYSTYSNIVGIERAARTVGYSTMIASSLDLHNGPTEAFQELVARGVDGIIVSEPVDDTNWSLDVLGGTPLVTIGSDTSPADRVMIGYDQAKAAEIATTHLLELGHSTVWHLAGPRHSKIARARQVGWQRALVRASSPVPTVLYANDWSARGGFEAGEHLMAMPEATAAFAANDRIAFGLMRAVVASGRTIPDDFSVVGFDDIPESEFQIIPLTTIHEDPATLAERAVAELVNLISGELIQPRKVELPLELVVRCSTGPAPSHAESLLRVQDRRRSCP